jgi:phosphatidylserine/phosphatidylglycerophosphate/cardiolipin synthase-like enzyme
VLQGPRPTSGNDIEFLIDNEAAWGRLADEIAAATTSVRAMLFMLDIPHVRLRFDRPLIGNPGPTGSVRLEELLLAAAQRGVDVTLLINDVQPAISPANTTRAVEAYFRRHDPRGEVRLARLRTPQAAPIHAKVFIIDGRVAYLIGSVFAQDYFDGRHHRIDDPRRGQLHWRSLVRSPVHDVSERIEGPAVADIAATFALHWSFVRPADQLPGDPPPGTLDSDPRRPAGVTVQVTRTLHGARYAGLPEGETGIFESYLRALETARDFIYLENQYFTCVELVDAIVAAMRRAPGLQLIALLNQSLGIPGYDRWQGEAIERLLSGLGGGAADRVGMFTLWTHEPGDGRDARPVVLRTYVHSKLAIIDDTWLTAGSANLDGLSLLAGEHALRWPLRSRLGRLVGLFGAGDPRLARSSEVNVTVAALPGEPAPAGIGRVRRDLWAEHLGYDFEPHAAADMSIPPRPASGWLSLWRGRADQNLAALRAGDPRATRARILPLPITDDRVPRGVDRPASYLRALGLPVDRIDLRREFRSFSFERGRWR